MTTIIITTWFGRWDEAAALLKHYGMTLSIENIVQVQHEDISRCLLTIWNLAADSVIAGFTVNSEGIRATV